jgi:single-strand DNA-binding protein
MKDVNKIILVGRVGAEPVRRETRSGLAVTHFPVATSRRLRGPAEDGAGGAAEAGGSPVEETEWHRIVVWGREAELCSRHLRKGQTVFVEGMVRTRRFDAKDGTSRIAFEVHADQVSFIGAPRGLRLAGHPGGEIEADAAEDVDSAPSPATARS